MGLMVDPVFFVINLCSTISSEMRRNARWAQSGASAILGSSPLITDVDQEKGATKLHIRGKSSINEGNNNLMMGFAKLRTQLDACDDFTDIDSYDLLAPFLKVISSQITNGRITSLALSSVTSLLTYELINQDSKNLPYALGQLIEAATHCRFEATDQSEDDGVLLKILSLLEDVMTGSLGNFLSDSSVCEIIETCLSMACQMRRGDVLRRCAETTMIRLCQTLFLKLKTIPVDDIVDDEDEVQVSAPKVTSGDSTYSTEAISVAQVDVSNRVDGAKPEAKPESKDEPKDGSKDGSNAEPKDESKTEPQETETIEEDIYQPFGISSIREALRVLISIIDPANYHQYTDSTRILSLKLLNVAFETGGPEIGEHPSLLNPLTTLLTKYLCQLIRTDNPNMLRATFKTVLTLFHTNSSHLKLHLEFILSYILTCLSPVPEILRQPGVDDIFYEGVPNVPKLVKVAPLPASSGSTPQRSAVNLLSDGNNSNTSGRLTPGASDLTTIKSPEIRELMIDFLNTLSRTSRNGAFFTELFINYDCDIDRTDLSEDLIGFLCRNAYPDSAEWSTLAVPPLCLEAILAYVSNLNKRIRIMSNSAEGANTDDKVHSVQKITDSRSMKKLAISITETFNNNAKRGIKMLIDTKVIPDDSPEAIAKFLKSSGRLNKTVLGEYLSKSDNIEILAKFIESFDFSETRLDEALREFLSFFRLPGESQLIERIFEKFASQYCKGRGNTEFVFTEDAAFVLSYAVIMLNTDLYNPQNKRQMTVEEFCRNLSGANDGKNFSEEYLTDIYKTIRAREIVMPDEHDNDETFEYAWRRLTMSQAQAGEYISDCPIIYDRYAFEVTWRPIITTFAYVFATATEDAVFSRVITGFNQAAAVADRYGIPGVVDHIVSCLSWISTLPAGDFMTPINNLQVEVYTDDGEDAKPISVTVSDLSISFGNDYKAQMATVTLFRVAQKYSKSIKEGWLYIVAALANLFLYDLIDSPAPPIPEIRRLAGTKARRKFKKSKKTKDGGIFSALSSYLTSYNDGVSEPTDEEVDSTLVAIDCITASGISHYIQDVLSQADENLAMVITETTLSCIPNVTDAPKSTKESYYSVMLYFMDLCASLGVRYPSVAEKLAAVIASDYLENWTLWKHGFLFRCIALYLGLYNSTNGQLELSSILTIDHEVLKAASPALIDILLTGVMTPEKWELVSICASNCSSRVFEYIKSPEVSQNMPVAVLSALVNSKPPKSASQGQGKDNVNVDALNLLFEKEDELVKVGSPQWFEYAKEIGRQTANSSREIRSQALSYLERLMLSPELATVQGFDWENIFDEVVFPFVSVLLKPEMYEVDPEGMGLTRLHVASFMCKLFLQYVIHEQQTGGSNLSVSVWTRILDTLDRLLNSGPRDSLKEAVIESLKNVLLVVKSSELADDRFWNETWTRIDKVLPTLRENIETAEVKPDESKKSETKHDELEQAAGEVEAGEKKAEEDQEQNNDNHTHESLH